MNDDSDGCYACRLTLAEWCAIGVPVRICGLCELMEPSMLHRYAEKWEPKAAVLPPLDKPEEGQA